MLIPVSIFDAFARIIAYNPPPITMTILSQSLKLLFLKRNSTLVSLLRTPVASPFVTVSVLLKS